MKRFSWLKPLKQSVLLASCLCIPAIAVMGIVGVASMAGCSTVDKALYKPQVEQLPPVIVTNVVLETNLVVVHHSTNEGGLGLPTFEHVVTAKTNYQAAPPAYKTNIAPNPTVSTGIDLVGALPFPFAGTVGIALGWLYTAYAAFRNKKVNVALVKSVEAGRDFLKETPEGQKLDAKFTELLEKHQDTAGVLKEVNNLLAQYVQK